MYNYKKNKGENRMDQVLIILAFLVGLVGLYFTYMIVNVVVTIIKSKKRDH